MSENYIIELLFQHLSVTGNCKFVFCCEKLICDLLHPDMTGSASRGSSYETADSLGLPPYPQQFDCAAVDTTVQGRHRDQ